MARNFKTIASASLCAATLLVGGWSAPAVAGSDVAITMPEDKNERWRKDAAALVEQLEGAGYTVDLRFANDDLLASKASQQKAGTLIVRASA